MTKINEKQKEKVTSMLSQLDQQNKVLSVYLEGIKDGFNLVGEYVFDTEKMEFITKKETTENKQNGTPQK